VETLPLALALGRTVTPGAGLSRFSNLTFAHPAKFVRRYGDAAALITQAVLAYKADVVGGQFADADSYHLPKDTQAALERLSNESGFAA